MPHCPPDHASRPYGPVQPRPGGGAVTVLMAVYDGEGSLGAQLESLAAQHHRDWRLLASDDGSSDNSRAILSAFADRFGGRVRCLDGPGAGAAANFLFLIRQAGAALGDEGWIAFCDQDDVWQPDRLSRGVAALSREAPDRPALYCSRTWITDPALSRRRLSVTRPRPPGFRNALVQNIASGNTILLNPAASRLVVAAAAEVATVTLHDWWVYQLVTGAGGVVVHDDIPTLFYRQHGANQIGANDRLAARLWRMGMVLTGRFRRWNDVNIAALQASAHRFTDEHRLLLAGFQRMRAAGPAARLAALRRLGLYRQGRAATAALWIAAALGQV